MDHLPEIELTYDKLCLSISVPDSSDSIVKRIGRRFFRGTPRLPTRQIKLLNDISGAILPGRLTLVLGAPG